MKSTERIQFELACMRLAYRLRPEPLNRRRRTGLMPAVPPLLFLAVYGVTGALTFAFIAWFFITTGK